MKYLYILAGLILITLSVIFFSWFYTDFIYLLANPTILFVWGRLGVVLASFVLGVFYLVYGLKPRLINPLSNTSLTALLCSLALSFIFIVIYSAESYIGGQSPWYAGYAYLAAIAVLVVGVLTTLVLCITSMFKNKN
jgi:hypothetical protein